MAGLPNNRLHPFKKFHSRKASALNAAPAQRCPNSAPGRTLSTVHSRLSTLCVPPRATISSARSQAKRTHTHLDDFVSDVLPLPIAVEPEHEPLAAARLVHELLLELLLVLPFRRIATNNQGNKRRRRKRNKAGKEAKRHPTKSVPAAPARLMACVWHQPARTVTPWLHRREFAAHTRYSATTTMLAAAGSQLRIGRVADNLRGPRATSIITQNPESFFSTSQRPRRLARNFDMSKERQKKTGAPSATQKHKLECHSRS